MKKIILILILQLFCSQIFAEEVKTRLGYSVKLPTGYTIATNENLNGLIDNYKEKKMVDFLGNNFSTNFFELLQCNPSNEMASQECIFSDDLSPQYNVIMLVAMNDGIKMPPNTNANNNLMCEVEHRVFIAVLDIMKSDEFKAMGYDPSKFNEDIVQHSCYYTDTLKPKFNISHYSVHDGFIKDMLVFKYSYQLPSGNAATIVQCSLENCIQLLKEGAKITKSIN